MIVRRLPRTAAALLVLAAGASSALAQTKASKPKAKPGVSAPALTLPAEAYLLPQNSVMVFGVDVHGFFTSKLWADITNGTLSGSGLTPEKAAEAAKQAREGLAKGMTEMEESAGFRADRDVDWVFVAMRNPDAPSPDVAGVVLGRFDGARIMAATEAAQKKEGGNTSRRQAGGVTILTSSKSGKPGMALAVPSANHLLFGDEALLEELLQADAGHKRPLDANVAMVTRLRGLRAGTGVFVLAGEALMQKAAQGGTPPPFPLPRNVGLTFAYDGTMELVAEMPTAADATQGVNMIQSQLGMVGAMLASDKDPQKAVAGKILSGLSVKAEDKTLRVTAGAGSMSLGTLAAMAIPSMMAARTSANESAAIGDIRTVISAQAAYQSSSGGLYGDLTCLSTPATCIKAYKGPVFLDTQLTSLQPKNGYRRGFYPGKKGKGLHAWQGYAYTAVPVEPGKTGTRSFCGGEDGVIRFDPAGGDIKPVGGACPATLKPLE